MGIGHLWESENLQMKSLSAICLSTLLVAPAALATWDRREEAAR